MYNIVNFTGGIMDKYQQQVLDVQNVINANRSEEVELEIAMEIIDTDEGRIVYPGINIQVQRASEPVFISIGELKVLLKAADKYCTNILNKE